MVPKAEGRLAAAELRLVQPARQLPASTTSGPETPPLAVENAQAHDILCEGPATS